MPLDNTNDLIEDLNNLGNNNDIKTLWEDITGNITGTITVYQRQSPYETEIIPINLDKWMLGEDALVVPIENSRPTDKGAVKDTNGKVILADIDANGDYILLVGYDVFDDPIPPTPPLSPTNYALIWQIKGEARDTFIIPSEKEVKDFDSDPAFVRDPDNNQIIAVHYGDDLNMGTGGFKDFFVSTAKKLGDALNTTFNTTNQTILGAVNELEQIRDITKDPTGFSNPENVIVSYDSTTRKITLTGTNWKAYYRGEIIPDLISSWVSDAHPTDLSKKYYLMYNGTSYIWGESGFDYTIVQIAYVYYYPTIKFGLRENHEFLSHNAHLIDHEAIGTRTRSGGSISNVVLNSITPADRRPDVSSTLIADEELPSTLEALEYATEKYTQYYISGANGDANFIKNSDDIIPLLINQPYFNELVAGVWQNTLMTNNRFTSIWIGNLPSTADAESKTIRRIFILGQSQTASEEAQELQSPNDLTYGGITDITPEFVIDTQLIVKYIGGNWQITKVKKITGSRFSQSSTQPSTGLSVVESDPTLLGLGTISSPLGINLANPNTWSVDQTFNGHIAVGTNGVVQANDILRVSEAFFGDISGIKTGINIFTVAYPGINSDADYIGISTFTNTDASPNGTTGSITGSQSIVVHSANLGTTISKLFGATCTSFLGGVVSETNDLVEDMYGIKTSSFANSSNTGIVATNVYGIDVSAHQSGKGTISNLYGANIATSITDVSGNITNAYGLKISYNHVAGTTENSYGIWIGNINGAETNNYGIVLDGDDLGSGIIFGDDQDASIYFDGTDLIISPGGDLNVQGNITLTGTVDGVDIGTDVPLNTTHRGLTNNPHSVSQSQVGLGNVDNTSDADKPVSTAQQTALDLKADDNAVVHLTGNESIGGVKTFTSQIKWTSAFNTTNFYDTFAKTSLTSNIIIKQWILENDYQTESLIVEVHSKNSVGNAGYLRWFVAVKRLVDNVAVVSITTVDGAGSGAYGLTFSVSGGATEDNTITISSTGAAADEVGKWLVTYVDIL